MNKVIAKIELEGKIIGSKPLLSDDILSSVRIKIKEKTKDINYQFLDSDGNNIEIQDEGEYKLCDIIVEKIIKISKINNSENQELIKVFLNDKEFCQKNISKSQNLSDVRNYLKNEIKQDFIFLDSDGNDIEKQDEKEYSLKDILKNQSIYLKCDIQNNQTLTTLPAPNAYSEVKINNITASKPREFDLSKYNEIKNEESNLKLYKYSEKERESKHERVYEYFYDDFDLNDYKDAYIVLFCGKTGDGKSTAINAFFNIVKGIRLEDEFRFILIKEPEKKGGQSVSQTDGIHLYYVKDYNNKPMIIIDSQGYGDTRGPQEDLKITKAFSFVFTQIIDHINAACFIAKATNNRLDILTKYIFSSVTSLFAEDISENFIILATFANSETMRKGPNFIESINQDADFLNINKRMDKNYWYAFDSKCIFDDDFNSKLTKYSYEQICKLYEEKIKKLFPQSTKESGEVVTSRETLKIEVNNLNTTFKALTVEQENLKGKENQINESNLKIKDLENKIKALKDNKNNLNKKEYEEELRKFNEEFNERLKELTSRTRKERKRILKADSNNKYTRCDECLENCHDPCECWFTFTGRCKIYPIIGSTCEKCGHRKKVHKQEYYHYVYEEFEVAGGFTEEKNFLNEQKEKENAKYNERIQQQNKEKDSLQRQLNELNYNLEDLLEEKRKYEAEKKEVEIQVNNINKKMKIIIMKLQRLSDEIYRKGMNKNHIKNENEYIDTLSTQMQEIGYKEDEIKEKLGDIKKNNTLLNNVVKIPQEELLMKNADELMAAYGNPNNNN